MQTPKEIAGVECYIESNLVREGGTIVVAQGWGGERAALDFATNLIGSGQSPFRRAVIVRHNQHNAKLVLNDYEDNFANVAVQEAWQHGVQQRKLRLLKRVASHLARSEGQVSLAGYSEGAGHALTVASELRFFENLTIAHLWLVAPTGLTGGDTLWPILTRAIANLKDRKALMSQLKANAEVGAVERMNRHQQSIRTYCHDFIGWPILGLAPGLWESRRAGMVDLRRECAALVRIGIDIRVVLMEDDILINRKLVVEFLDWWILYTTLSGGHFVPVAHPERVVNALLDLR